MSKKKKKKCRGDEEGCITCGCNAYEPCMREGCPHCDLDKNTHIRRPAVSKDILKSIQHWS